MTTIFKCIKCGEIPRHLIYEGESGGYGHADCWQRVELIEALGSQLPVAQHRVTVVSELWARVDCCGDRYPSYVQYSCTCGLKFCKGCMLNHLLELHR